LITKNHNNPKIKYPLWSKVVPNTLTISIICREIMFSKVI
jgi:hypothetical protein